MRIGFVIVTYNRSEALTVLLQALAPQCSAQDVVVVADDGSRPSHVDALLGDLPACAAPMRHVWHPDVGFTAGRARNLGVAVARELGVDYVVFMDGDCVPGPGFAQAHRALAQAGCFVNGSRVLLSPCLTDRVMSRQVDLHRLGWWDWLRLRWSGDVNKLGHLVEWPSLPGRRERAFRWQGIRSCNFGAWLSDLEAVDGFDETFSGWGHEDADLVLRLHNHGLMRKNGHWATEVFHLWHREQAREREAGNRQRVQARQRAGTTRAEVGLSHARLTPPVQVSVLGVQQGAS
jgi:glycosyltransferase involved in cell wall biosynthesis